VNFNFEFSAALYGRVRAVVYFNLHVNLGNRWGRMGQR